MVGRGRRESYCLLTACDITDVTDTGLVYINATALNVSKTQLIYLFVK